MKHLLSVFFVFLSLPVFAAHHGDDKPKGYMPGKGMIHVKSVRSVSATVEKLEQTLISKGMTIFNRIDHAGGAKKTGQTLRPTRLVIFGNPKVGTPLMQCAQTMAIDLPQKILIWEDNKGDVWLSYNDLRYLAKRHEARGCDDVLEKVAGVLNNVAELATSS